MQKSFLGLPITRSCYDITLILHVDFKKGQSESRSVVSDSVRPHALYRPWDSPGQHSGVGSLSLLQGIFPTQGSNPGLPCVCVCVCVVCVLVVQLWPALCNAIDYSLPGSSVHGVLQTRILEQVAISFSKKSDERNSYHLNYT